MRRQIDFAAFHEGRWREGEMPKTRSATYVVSFDQRHDAYHVQRADYDDFIEWVAQQWEAYADERDMDEDAQDYLDRIGCSVQEL